MKTLGNILWVVFVGWWSALSWLLLALLFAVTVVGAPFARQCLKFAQFTLWPFGRVAVVDMLASKMGTVGAAIWFVPGLILAIGYILGGALLCLTVIGIPFGMQSFKFASLSIAPFGKKIVTTKDLKQAMGAVGT
ncbi:MAG: YccF domain-containing protein [Ilumatobacteraceae bacterium]